MKLDELEAAEVNIKVILISVWSINFIEALHMKTWL